MPGSSAARRWNIAEGHGSIEPRPFLPRRLLDSQKRVQLEAIMLDAVERYLSEVAKQRPRDVPLSYGDREVLLRFTACGLVGVLLEYGRKPNMDQDLLAAQLERILSGELLGWRSPDP